MSIVRMRPPASGCLRDTLLGAADVALRKLSYSEAFRVAVRSRLSRVFDGVNVADGYVDFSQWPEYTALDRETVERIGPFVQRLADAVSTAAFTSLAATILVPEVIAHVETLSRAPIEPPDDPPEAA